ncbi:MAG: Transcriptional regulator, TetR family [Betaproteobacteria bacterium]|nr:Transcriptional regulator, TetR family [Betaproteobacteria bacterium]
MKISREQVAKNRETILKEASRLFRERGFDGVTVAEVMTAAGLTHGAFYGYFDSKEDLIAQAANHVLTPKDGVRGADRVGMAIYADNYLSAAHRDELGDACLFSSLGTEAVRGSGDLRHALTESLRGQIDSFSSSAPGKTAEEKRRAAIGSWSAMIGAVILARIADDPALSDEVLRETRAWIGA